MKKQMKIMLTVVGTVFGLIFSWKIGTYLISKYYMSSMQEPAVTVSTMRVASLPWESQLESVASLRAIYGVNVTTELAGLVQAIYFNPGERVKKGSVLVQLNADAELGQLHALEAQVELAKITYKRDQAQYAAHAISKQTLDTDEWTLKNLQAQVAQQAAIVAKKTIRAPFSGYLGICNIDLGQYLDVGNTVTTLQSYESIYADFYLPQQDIPKLKVGQPVELFSDAYPNRVFKGKITTIQPEVDDFTRNVEVEATLENSNLELKPGMFAKIQVTTGKPKNYLTLPQSAISFNPYGEIVFLVKADEKRKDNLIAHQLFVTVGPTRGDQIVILKGLKEGDTVVSSGQLKLRNGSRIIVNNSVQPSFQANPTRTQN